MATTTYAGASTAGSPTAAQDTLALVGRILLAALWQQPLLAILASLMWLAGAIVFLVQLISLAHTSAAPEAPAA